MIDKGLIPSFLSQLITAFFYFNVQTCNDLLLNDFFDLNGHVYCERDYYEKRSFHCRMCDQIIFGSFIEFEGSQYHPEHFMCWNCQCNLSADESESRKKDGKGGSEFRKVVLQKDTEGVIEEVDALLCMSCLKALSADDEK